MSEIERAIQEFEDNAYHTSMKPTISEASKAVALRILRAELSRQENAPPKCYECKNEADSWEWERCIWGDKSDRYEPKEEPTCTQD